MAMIGQRMTAEEFLVLDVPEWPRMELLAAADILTSPLLLGFELRVAELFDR